MDGRAGWQLGADWKRANQGFDFGAPSDNTPGGNAAAGLAVSRVTGTPTADEFWQHADLIGNPTGGLQQLQRGSTLGATGWEFGTEYEFSFVFLANSLQVYVDDVLEGDTLLRIAVRPAIAFASGQP